MKVISSALSKLEHIDIFASPVSLRYNCKQSYRTKTGSCFSIGLLCFLLFSIYPFFTTLLNYEDINVTEFISYEENPTTVTIDKYNFFFAIGIFGVNMFSQTSKLFEYELIHYTVENAVVSKADTINLVPCDETVFKSTYSAFSDIYAKMQLSHYLCLPENIFLNISGKESRGNYEYLSFRVKGCHANCASAADVLKFSQLEIQYYINFFLINKLLNPNMKQPISYYFEDKLFSIMSGNLLKKTNLFISEYVISTEQSLFMPFSHEVADQGFFININQQAQTTMPVTNRTYLELNLFKSDQKYNILRSYVTVGDLLSYVGGLFAIYVMLFGCVLAQYNKLCFSLKLYRKIFFEEPDEPNQQNTTPSQAKQLTFNFFTFIKYMISQVIFVFCSPKSCSSMYQIKQKIEETQNKINVDDFVDRIVSFEKNFKCLLDFEQITLLMLQDKNTITDERDRRRFIDKNIEAMSFASSGNILKINQISPADANQAERTKIYEAIADLQDKMNKGDQKCQKILQGVSRNILEQYEKNKKQKSKDSEKESSQVEQYSIVVPRFNRNLKQKPKKSSFFA